MFWSWTGVRKAMHGRHLPPSPREKIEESLLLGEVMITVYWRCEGVIVVTVLLRWETFSSIAYIRTLTALRKHFKLIQPDQNPTEILLHHDNARLHTSLKTWEAITEYGVTVLCHPPCSLNVAPSDFCLFGALNDAICSMKFEIDDVIHIMRTCLCEQDKAWYRQGLHTLISHWCKAVEVNRNLWKHRIWSKSIAFHNV